MMKRTAWMLVLAAALLTAACGGNKEQSKPMTTEDAIAVLNVKIEKNSKDHRSYFQRAKLLIEVGRVNEAISDLVHATQLDNDNSEYLMLLADAYFANGDVEHSYNTLDEVLKLDPDNDEATLKQGEIAYYSRDYDRALASLSKVTEKDPQNRTALFMKSFIYKEKGDTASAVTLLRKVCDIYPDFAQAFEELGVLYSAHRSPLAEQYLATAIKLDPNNTNSRYALGMYYQDIKRYDAAEECYKELLDIDNNNKYAWHNRGYIAMTVYGDDATAIEHFTRALQCDSTFIEARANRAYAYELSGDRQHAREDYTRVLQQAPAYPMAAEGLKRVK